MMDQPITYLTPDRPRPTIHSINILFACIYLCIYTKETAGMILYSCIHAHLYIRVRIHVSKLGKEPLFSYEYTYVCQHAYVRIKEENSRPMAAGFYTKDIASYLSASYRKKQEEEEELPASCRAATALSVSQSVSQCVYY